MIGRHGLVIGGDVVRGEGIVVPPHILGQPVEGLVREILGRLEHQMFEQVGEARAVLRIVLGADPVPDLDGDVRGRGVARGEDPQPVRQDPLPEAERRDDDGVGRFGSRHHLTDGRRSPGRIRAVPDGGAGRDAQHQGGD